MLRNSLLTTYEAADEPGQWDCSPPECGGAR
jgi:hypothetical protein